MGLLDQWAGKKLESYKPTGDGLLNVTKNAVASLFDPESPLSKKAAAWNKKLQKGIQHSLEGKDTPYAEFAYQEGLNMAGLGAMTAWHGSPHKFDKFSLDKIGTGEGAQAYGHGLYLAESPEVAGQYQKTLSADGFLKADGSVFDPHTSLKHMNVKVPMYKGDIDAAIEKAKTIAASDSPAAKLADDDLQTLMQIKESGGISKNEGQLYKTDIPDEAVARFLDWDKPLSQQAPEVQAALLNREHEMGAYISDAIDMAKKYGGDAFNPTGKELYESVLTPQFGGADAAQEYLRQSAGIPGIRYLDGGSRSAGQGSSNFVIFDPDMIRIIERNGQSTGLLPWSPGEYGLLK